MKYALHLECFISNARYFTRMKMRSERTQFPHIPLNWCLYTSHYLIRIEPYILWRKRNTCVNKRIKTILIFFYDRCASPIHCTISNFLNPFIIVFFLAEKKIEIDAIHFCERWIGYTACIWAFYGKQFNEVTNCHRYPIPGLSQ